ncbi:MAG: thiamine biosynthesis protein ApbE [Flavobacteriaceae bacterium]|nr:thiamine biosynthesis protein ApbE [Flavobacteriaceae bacterium]
MIKNLLFIVSIVLLFGCEVTSEKIHIIQGNAFGTTYSIQYYSQKDFDAERGIDSVVYAVNKSVSTYMPNSDISKINQGDATVVVDSIFSDVFLLSEKIHKQSQGYFDPTIGVLRNAYGFGDTKPLQKMDSLTLDSLMQFVGFSKVKLTQEGTIQKQFPEIYFDFNAVAKGYGIDCLGRYLESQGVTHYLIELGGELLSKGQNIEKQKPWVVGIEAVDSELENRSYTHTVVLQNEGMASSGNYRKFRIDSLTGKKYVHTLNPLTGEAEESDVTSATVIAATCAEADAYATAFMAMGLKKSKTLLSELDQVEAYLTYIDAHHQPQVFVTEGFKNRILE